MNTYYKYLPISKLDINWGLYLINVGYGQILPNATYPAREHPAHHYFNWDKGRVFDEFQIIYIPKGEGVFESSSQKKCIVKEGSIILLYPNEWHRYKPSRNTGWDEYWIGFNGKIAKNLMKKGFFSPAKAVIKIGINEEVLKLFNQIIERAKIENAGYQQYTSGVLFNLLGLILSISKSNDFNTKDQVQELVDKARVLYRSNIEEEISAEKVAEELQISYASFRKIFKEYTGIAPGQYFLQLKIERAKLLLSNPAKSVKEVAFQLNFSSEFYFSRLFKAKVGMPPAHYQESIFKNNNQNLSSGQN